MAAHIRAFLYRRHTPRKARRFLATVMFAMPTAPVAGGCVRAERVRDLCAGTGISFADGAPPGIHGFGELLTYRVTGPPGAGTA